MQVRHLSCVIIALPSIGITLGSLTRKTRERKKKKTKKEGGGRRKTAPAVYIYLYILHIGIESELKGDVV